MQDLTKKFTDLYEQLIVRSTKLDSEKEVTAQRKVLNFKRYDELEAQKKDLDSREKEIKKIEDVVKLQDEVATAYRDLIKGKKALKSDQAKLEEEKKNNFKENKEASEAVSSRKIKLQKAELMLDKQKTDYKAEVMININKLLASKGIKL